ncbi:MAG: hypothetical protein ACTSUK_03775, partial [Promethearchaeota archaeon]
MKTQQNLYRDKYVLKKINEDDMADVDPTIIEADQKELEEETYIYEKDVAQQEFPFATGFRRHKVPSNKFDKISIYRQQLINYNRKHINRADVFHDARDVRKLKFIEDMAQMFQDEERNQFEHRNSFAYDGYTYPAKWVVTFYLEHNDQLAESFKHQMDYESGTPVLDNFANLTFHGWNKFTFDAYKYWFLKDQTEVPIAIHYFRKAGIRFKIWPACIKQAAEPESTVSLDEWFEWLSKHKEINWKRVLEKSKVQLDEFLRIQAEQEKLEREQRRLDEIKRRTEIEKIKAQKQKERRRKSGWMKELDQNIARNRKIEEERIKEEIKQKQVTKKKRERAITDMKDLVYMIARADEEMKRVDKEIRNVKVNIARTERERSRYVQMLQFKLRKLKKEIPFPGNIRTKSLYFFEIPQFMELIPYSFVFLYILASFKNSVNDLWNISDRGIKKIWEEFGHGMYRNMLIDDVNFFNKLFDRRSYFLNFLKGNIAVSRKIRVISLDFPNLYPIGLNRFVRLWKAAANNEDIYRPQLLTVIPLKLRKKIKSGFTLANIPMRTFLKSPMVKLALDFVVPDAEIMFYGVELHETRKQIPIIEQLTYSDYSVEKFDLPNLSVKEAWDYFAKKDKILVIQNPLTDQLPTLYLLRQTLPFITNYFKRHNLYVTNFPSITNN